MKCFIFNLMSSACLARLPPPLISLISFKTAPPLIPVLSILLRVCTFAWEIGFYFIGLDWIWLDLIGLDWLLFQLINSLLDLVEKEHLLLNSDSCVALNEGLKHQRGLWQTNYVIVDLPWNRCHFHLAKEFWQVLSLIRLMFWLVFVSWV